MIEFSMIMEILFYVEQTERGFLILVLLTRYISLGSCWAGLSLPFVTWFVYQDLVLLVLAILIGGLILWKHRENIKRLLTGTENKFSLHKKK